MKAIKIMKAIKTIALISMLVMAQVAQAEFRWMSIKEIIERGGSEINDVTAPNGYWAGSVVAVGLYDTGEGFKFAGNLKVKITWITDRTYYQCHKVYEMQQKDIKDFTHRSIMLRRCR